MYNLEHITFGETSEEGKLAIGNAADIQLRSKQAKPLGFKFRFATFI
jgi:hypothetical protein